MNRRVEIDEGILVSEVPMYAPSNTQRRHDSSFDVDGMSYEQLLELENQIGKVEKGLSKDQLSQLPVKVFQTRNSSENR